MSRDAIVAIRNAGAGSPNRYYYVGHETVLDLIGLVGPAEAVEVLEQCRPAEDEGPTGPADAILFEDLPDQFEKFIDELITASYSTRGEARAFLDFMTGE